MVRSVSIIVLLRALEFVRQWPPKHCLHSHGSFLAVRIEIIQGIVLTSHDKELEFKVWAEIEQTIFIRVPLSTTALTNIFLADYNKTYSLTGLIY